MSLEQAIHQRWNSDLALSARLPVERLRTGGHVVSGNAAASATLPYATLLRSGHGGSTRLSGGLRVDCVNMKLRIWAGSLADLKQLAELIQRRYGGKDFNSGAVRVLDMRLTDRKEVLQDDGVWRLELDYLTRVETREKP